MTREVKSLAKGHTANPCRARIWTQTIWLEVLNHYPVWSLWLLYSSLYISALFRFLKKCCLGDCGKRTTNSSSVLVWLQSTVDFIRFMFQIKTPAVFHSLGLRRWTQLCSGLRWAAVTELLGTLPREPPGADLDHVLLDTERVAVAQDTEQLIIGNEEEPGEGVPLGI